MICPACLKSLERIDFTGIEIDLCRNCRGIWFDTGELALFITRGSIPMRLLAELPRTEDCSITNEGERWCPRCSNLLQTTIHRAVTVDFCCRCNGIWFDSGELKQMLLDYCGELRTRIRDKRANKDKTRVNTDTSGKSEALDSINREYLKYLVSHSDNAPAGIWHVLEGVDFEEELLRNCTVEEIYQALPAEITRNPGRGAEEKQGFQLEQLTGSVVSAALRNFVFTVLRSKTSG